MAKVPAFLLKKLYVKRSLDTDDDGFWFKMKNVLAEATLTEPVKIEIDDEEIPIEDIYIYLDDEKTSMAELAETGESIKLPLNVEQKVWIKRDGGLEEGDHTITISSVTEEYGEISFKIEDDV